MAIEFKKKTQLVRVDCFRGLNLLAHAQMDELEIGSRCGGWGECGGDRVLVTKGEDLLSALTDAEREHLTAGDIELGYRLACQAFPQQDDASIEIEVDI